MKRFLSLIATGAFALGLSTSASAQVRGIAAGALVLDDYLGHTITVQTPQFPSAAWSAWSAEGFPNLITLSPPPAPGLASAFIYPAVGATIQPYLTYWLPAGVTSPYGTGNKGGVTGAWDYATAEQLGIEGMTNPMTTLGDMIYEDGTPAAARVPGNTSTTKEFLTQTGTGTASAEPVWESIATGDLPASVTLQGNTFNGDNELVQLTAAGLLPILNGSNLTNLTGANVTGTVATAAALSPGATINGVNFTGAAPITVTASMNTLTGTNYAAGNGSAITNVAALTAASLTPGATINGVNFTGAAPITVTAAMNTLTGTNYAAGNGSAITNLTAANITGTVATAAALSPGATINGVNFTGAAPITVTAAMNTLTGTTYAAGNGSAITNVAALTAASLTPGATINGVNFTGAAPITVTAAMNTLTGTNYAAGNGSAITNLTAANITGTVATAAALSPGATINGVNFTGAAPITVTAAMNTLTGTNYAAGNGSAITNLTAANITGTVATAAALSPGATINGVNFTGAAPITVTAAMNTLTGTNYAAGNGSAITNLTAANITGTVATAAALSPGATINGVNFTGAAPITVTAAMNTLTGTNYAAGNGSAITNVAALTAASLTPGATINGVNFTGAAPITVTAAMNTLTGTNYAAGNGSAITNLSGANITAGSIPYTAINNETATTLLGNPTGTAASPSEITLGTGLAFSSGALTVSGAPPTGTAGGDLAGTYPNPTIAITGADGLSAGNDIIQALNLADGSKNISNTNISVTVGKGSFTSATAAAAETVSNTHNLSASDVALSVGTSFHGGPGGATALDVTNGNLSVDNGNLAVKAGNIGVAAGSIGVGGSTVIDASRNAFFTAITGTSTITFSGLPVASAAGIVHANGSGVLSSSLIVNADITAGTIADASLANETANTLLGNPTGTAASPTEITLGTGLAFSSGALTVTGAPPTGTAGGDLAGTYPNPTIAITGADGLSAGNDIIQALNLADGSKNISNTNISVTAGAGSFTTLSAGSTGQLTVDATGTVSTTGNISTTGTGAITSVGTLTASGNLVGGGSVQFHAITTTAAPYQALASDYYIIVNAGGTGVKMPAAAVAGQKLIITNATATAFAAGDFAVPPTTTWNLIYDGTNWQLIF